MLIQTGGNEEYGEAYGFNLVYSANFSAIDHVSNVKVGGSLGVYNAGGSPEMFEINDENFMTYVGVINSSYTSKVTGLSYVK